MLIQGHSLKIDDIYHIIQKPYSAYELSAEAQAKMKFSRAYIERSIDRGDVIYGVNTGFGAFSSVRISDSEIETLQKNFLRSHSAGVGEPFTKIQSRAIMILRANALATGHSGIRPEVVLKILEFLNQDIIPVIPSQGSVGASGDLSPLAHLALALIGEGQVWDDAGQIVDAQKVLDQKNVKPLVLKAKEGLSLCNGCQVMTAVGMINAFEARDLLYLADLSGALSLEALRGSRSAFDPLISASRPHVGETKTARNLMKLLGLQTEISDSHADCNKVQDFYSLRCMPAVHGAVKDQIQQIINTLEIEANSATDNPLVFAADDKILSCGNFHGMPVAFAMDIFGMVLSTLSSISERRIAKLTTASFSGLPAFLIKDGGLQSGHMIVQYTAASLVSENKVLAHPASVDSIPTSADKEDHVSMGTIAARKAAQILKNTQYVIAMEILSSCQGLDLLSPLKPSPQLQKVKDFVRQSVPYAEKDRIFANDIRQIYDLIKNRELISVLKKEVPDLEI